MELVKSKLLKLMNELIKNENFNCNKFIKEVTEDTQFEELQLDSISFIKLVVAIETEFDIEFEDAMLDYNSIKELKDLIIIIEKKIS